jgi:hypothetical protein
LFAICDFSLSDLTVKREFRSDLPPEVPKIRCMKLPTFLILILLVSVSFAATTFDSTFKALTGGEVERDSARVRLLAMSKADLARFMVEAKARTLSKDRFQVVRAFDVLRRRKDFDAALAEQMKQVLKTDPTVDILEERLGLLLEAKSGKLTPAKIQAELQFAALASEPSARRLARLTALTDAMHSVGLSPTVAQLEVLLQNDVYEIRMHAVDWFRISTPVDLKERGRFLKRALSSKPVQVRERAFRTIASWPASEVQALKDVDALPAKCATDTSAIIREACIDIREKALRP